MELICTMKQKGQLVQVGCKWCDGLNRDNFKFKTQHGSQPLRKGTTPSLYFIL